VAWLVKFLSAADRGSFDEYPEGSRPTQATILRSEIDHTKGTIRKYEDEICELEERPQNSEDARKSAIQEGIEVIRRTISSPSPS